jgi:ribosomal protein S18 acetylase RimI-like enzyme
VTVPPQTTTRRLGPGDEDVVARLADEAPRHGVLADPSVIMLAAFSGDEPVGMVLAYELRRRHGEETMLLVYELGVDEPFQRRGIATQLMQELARIARERGIGEGFLIAEPGNDAANALYASLGGERLDVVEWDFHYGDD